jgi:hypothetical protein
MENTNRQMVFNKSFLQGLDNIYLNSLIFSSSLHPKIVYEEKLKIFSDIHQFGYKLIELLDYSKKHQFLSEYINDLKNGGHPHLNGKVSENIDWYLKDAEECLLHVHFITISPVELSDFFLNAIIFAHLDQSKSKDEISYVWKLDTDTDLPELHSKMLDEYKLIASDTTYEQFKAIFTGKPIDTTFEPVRWLKNNASELLYFVLKLEESEMIEYNANGTDYSKMTACFVRPNGEKFSAAWKSLKTDIKINLSPIKQRAIDDLIESLQ